MPLASGEEVLEMINKERLDVQGPIRQIAAGIYKTLNQLQEHGFAHNDVKPDNMFFNKESLEVSLVDTGFMQKHSKAEGGKAEYVKSKQAAGTPGYMAPQIMQGLEHGPETDFYAFACTMLVATESGISDVLTNIYDREKDKGEKIISGHNPRDYLQIIIDEAKNSRHLDIVAAGESLERRLNRTRPSNRLSSIPSSSVPASIPLPPQPAPTWRSIPILTHPWTQLSKTSPTNFPSRASRASTSKKRPTMSIPKPPRKS